VWGWGGEGVTSRQEEVSMIPLLESGPWDPG